MHARYCVTHNACLDAARIDLTDDFCVLCVGVGLKTYMQVPDPTNPSAPPAIMRYDPVLQLLENTLSSPVHVDTTLEIDRSVVECPSVPRTFLNAVRARWTFAILSKLCCLIFVSCIGCIGSRAPCHSQCCVHILPNGACRRVVSGTQKAHAVRRNLTRALSFSWSQRSNAVRTHLPD